MTDELNDSLKEIINSYNFYESNNTKKCKFDTNINDSRIDLENFESRILSENKENLKLLDSLNKNIITGDSNNFNSKISNRNNFSITKNKKEYLNDLVNIIEEIDKSLNLN